MSRAQTVTPDDVGFLVPPEWVPRLDPRRDGGVTSSATLDRGARAKVKRMLTKAEAALAAVLDPAGPDDPALTAAAAEYREGEPTPLGAAAVLAVVATTVDAKHLRSLAAFADVWFKDHGAAFTAMAVVELAGIRVTAAAVPRGAPPVWRLGRRGPDTAFADAWRFEPVVRRVRELLASADDAEAEAARAALDSGVGVPSVATTTPGRSDETGAEAAEARFDDRLRHLVACYLMPGEQDRVTALCAAPWIAEALPTHCGLVLRSVSTPAQLAALPLTDPAVVGTLPISAEDLVTLAERVGAGLLPLVSVLLDMPSRTGPGEHVLLEILAHLPGDAAFDLIAARLGRRHAYAAAATATRRDPERTWRRLPVIAARGPITVAGKEHDPGPGAARLLWELTDDGIDTGASDPLVEQARRAALAAVSRPVDHRPPADAARLPGLFTEPPWRPGGTAVEPVFLEITAPADRGPVWLPGERAQWAAAETGSSPLGPDPDWARLVASFRSLDPSSAIALFVDGPADLVCGPLRWFGPDPTGVDPAWTRRLAARHGDLAASALYRTARESPHAHSPALLPYLGFEAVQHFARLADGAQPAAAHAEAYLDRHGMALVPYLTNLVTLRWHAGGHLARPNAVEWLRRLAARTSTAEVVEEARACGDHAASVIGELLAADPLDVLPRAVPVIGDWLDPALLPRILLRDTKHALPVDAVRTLLAAVGTAGLRREYAGLSVIEEACDRESLARFALALFQDWSAAGRPPGSEWVFAVVRYFGDDEAARVLAGRLGSWGSYGEPTLAEEGLNALAGMGTDAALRLIREISERSKPATLVRSAKWAVAAAARERGLDSEQLADRLVPDLGLSPDGTMELDYGARRFRVGFDEALQPFVTNADGTPRRSLPAPGARDDADQAAAARKRFTALKKSVRAIAAEQVRRLESAMVTGRRWRRSDFEALVRHPVLTHLVRRLVWLVERDGRVVATVRVAEDRSLADVHDDVVVFAAGAVGTNGDGAEAVGTGRSAAEPGEPGTSEAAGSALAAVPEDALFSVAHPLRLGDSAAAWSEVFADYEIVQPFRQLGRPVRPLTEEDRADWDLTRFVGRSMPTGRVRGLERRGWRFESPEAGTGGARTIITTTFGRTGLSLRLEPGFPMYDVPEDIQTISTVFVSAGRKIATAGPLTLGDLDPIEAAELIRALTELTADVG
ncbi:hypothetical protein FHR81_002162 [Actinoalloteichus hoggarensis]|uniref:DUF4132 domain-containing protein n=1 Tax=Actinoalloteichus hoggarensis TaxID=1470176 RepID=A0A221W672_9PSEU|nr:DUF4132 domain-containing protein [Actinoalloteichus hoggarensis]ASO21194.1 hypothetical protein AHOG_17845 [Actinoalloteichus hoggarensis]MBB5921124.1 hypothetical protein [Actinoalloteichus hoggarensis]